MAIEMPGSPLPDHAMSYWVDSTDQPSYPRLTDAIEADVAVVGGGIAGISTAAFLAEAGRDVALLEADEVLRGTTGHTTAKVTVGHGLRYQYLIDTFGERTARLYAEANRTALEAVTRRVRREGIDCEFTPAAAYAYALSEDRREAIQREVDAARRLGLAASYVEDVPAPVDAAAAVRYADQAHFHPREYLLALLETFEREGGRVYEHSRVTGIETGSPHVLRTRDGRVGADDVVVASHFPFYRRSLYTKRMLPHQEHVLAADVEGEPPEDMYVSVGPDTHSFRPVPTGEGPMLLVDGYRHPTGIGEDTMALTRQIESWTTETFPVEAVTYRWTVQDYETLDRVPYVGSIDPFADGVYVATGFGGWGVTHGTVAGLLLRDLILGRENAWAELYDPNRLPTAALKGLPGAGRTMLKQRAKGKRSLSGGERAPDLRPGEGQVVNLHGRTLGLYREDVDTWRAVEGTCPYGGCTLVWNGAGESWDCPCDGSRFTVDGSVVDGPAQEGLGRVPLAVTRRDERVAREAR
ncbi:FAD-dependent oxidoreductase [Halomicrobium salinisoli]|uniref:FAD-dependent oxidoreductase n=1 Tax=Halomicrobium salinisoli TaxID=2878391 RepID=UPI001CEFE208|nr:FAD-dependent oxidoreductase [Halomicrobium salinisoli]